jgi:hypothetical protein
MPCQFSPPSFFYLRVQIIVVLVLQVSTSFPPPSFLRQNSDRSIPFSQRLTHTLFFYFHIKQRVSWYFCVAYSLLPWAGNDKTNFWTALLEDLREFNLTFVVSAGLIC